MTFGLEIIFWSWIVDRLVTGKHHDFMPGRMRNLTTR